MDLKLVDKTAFISGSYRGTGLGIARVLLQEGTHVVIHGFEPGQAETTCQNLINDGFDPRKITNATGDITNDEGVTHILNAVENTSIDILINNYGTAERGRWGKSHTSDWIDAYEKNVLSAVRMIDAFLPQIKEKSWGRIIQIGTIGSYTPNKVMPQYYASKGALANLTVSLAKELARTGITVNTVSPGLIKTPEVETAYRAKAKKEGWGNDWAVIESHIAEENMKNPTGRIARVEEVGALVAFLCSEHADFLNGLNLRVDGGSLGLTI